MTKVTSTPYVHRDTNAIIGANSLTHVLANEHRLIGGSVYERVDTDRRVSTGKQFAADAENILFQASNSFDQRATEVVVEGTNELSLKGAFTHIEATHRLCLKAGPNYITIDPILGIFIQGSLTSINSGGPQESAKSAQPADTFDLLQPLEAYRSSCGEGKTGPGGSGTASRTHPSLKVEPKPPAPYPPGPLPPVPLPPLPPTNVCAITRFTATCEHGRSTHGDLLEVVPSSGAAHDVVTLAIETNGLCPGVPSWQRIGSGTFATGPTASFIAESRPKVKFWPPPTRDKDFALCHVVVADCGGAKQSKTINCYPSASLRYEHTFEYVKFVDNLIETILSFSVIRDLVGTVLPVKELSLIEDDDKAFVSAGYVEHSDHRAFFAYAIEVDFHTHIKGVFKLDVSKISKIITRLAKYIGISLNISRFLGGLQGVAGITYDIRQNIDLSWCRSAPDHPRIVPPSQESRVLFDIAVGLELGVKVPNPFTKGDLLSMKASADVLFAYGGIPVLSDTEIGVRGILEFKNIRVNSLTFSAFGINTPQTYTDPFFLLDPPDQQDDWRIEFNLDFTELLDALRNKA